MATKLIQFEGIMVEAEVEDGKGKQISGGLAEHVASSFKKITPILKRVCDPIIEL